MQGQGQGQGQEEQRREQDQEWELGDDDYELTVMSLEELAENRNRMRPDPHKDQILAVCWCIHEMGGRPGKPPRSKGVIAVDEDGGGGWRLGMPVGCDCVIVDSERRLFEELELLVVRRDPDILVGFECQLRSWGYLLQRAVFLSPPLNFDRGLSRCPSHRSSLEARDDKYGQDHASGLKVCGRELLNVWRLCRSEVKLPMYTYAMVCAKVINKREPEYAPETLTAWYTGRTAAQRSAAAAGVGRPVGGGVAAGTQRSGRLRRRAIMHVLSRAVNTLELVDTMDMIGRTCELARVFGIDFISVVTRGSQYRVESMMYRLARTQNYALISASSEQVQSQGPISCIPLVMSPESAFYTDPVLVLDFRSLYPSVVIAYNMCYSTCVGGDTGSRLGVDAKYSRDPRLVKAACADGGGFVSPNGVLFLSPKDREGILPRLLREILESRVVVKKLMKRCKEVGDTATYRKLNARQFGLKLIANVTYGYTSASASGRMPCVSIADSIVQTGRETLEAAIRMIEDDRSWDAKVVYGDTDSIFVLLKGRTRDQAFRIGKEISEKVVFPLFETHTLLLGPRLSPETVCPSVK